MRRGDILSDRFKIIKQLFTAGEKTFYLAADKLHGKNILVAPLEDLAYATQKELTEKEFQLLNIIQSKNTLELHEKIDTGKEAFLTYNYTSKLTPIIKSTAKAPYQTRSRIAKDLFQLIGEFHANNIFVGYILPNFLLIDEKGNLLLTNLTNCKGNAAKSTEFTNPLPDSIFVAPEIFSTNRCTLTSDIYCLSLIIGLMFSSGRFKDEELQNSNREKTVAKIIFQIRRNFKNPDWLGIIMKSLSEKISERPKTVNDLYKNIFIGEKLEASKKRYSPKAKKTHKTEILTNTILKEAFKKKEYSLANTLSETDIESLLSKGSKEEKIGSALTLMKMWSKTGSTKHLKLITEKLQGINIPSKNRESYNYHLALNDYFKGKTKKAKTKLSGINLKLSASHNLMGMIFQREGKFIKAEQAYQKAVQISSELKDKSNHAIYTGNLAYLKQVIGNYTESLKLYDESIKELTKLGEKQTLVSALFNKSSLLIFFGSFSEAKTLLNKALSISTKNGLKRQEALCRNLFGELYKFTGEYEKQEEMAKEAIAIFTDIEDSFNVYRSYIQLGWNALRSASASTLKDILMRINVILNANPHIDSTEYTLLHVCYLRKYSPYSVEHMRSLLSIKPDILKENLPLKFEWIKLLGYVLHDGGEKKEAISKFKEAEAILKEIETSIPKEHQKHFKRFMEKERLKTRIKTSRYTNVRRRVAMEISEMLPQIYDSFTTAIKGIVEKIPSFSQQQIIIKDIFEVLGADSVVCYKFEKGMTVPIASFGDVDPENVLEKIGKQTSKLNKWKQIKDKINNKNVILLCAPMSTGKELTGIIVAILPISKSPKVHLFGDLLASYADLLEVVDIANLTTQITSSALPPISVIDDKKAPQKSSYIFGDSPIMESVKENTAKAISSTLPTIIFGEDGTGKQTLAKHIHFLATPDKNIKTIDCRQTENIIIYGEIFGTDNRPGALENLKGGTLVLLHIERLDWEMQNHLLNYLKEGTYQPAGSRKHLTSNVRIIGTSYEKMWDAVDSGRLSNQLVRKMGIIKINIPSLSNRKDDIENLISAYFKTKNFNNSFDKQTLNELKHSNWPFNTAELFRVADSCAGLSKEKIITNKILQKATKTVSAPTPAASDASTLTEMLRESEKKIIENALEKYGHDKELTARALGISKSNLYKKMRDFSLIGKITKDQIIAAVKACGGNKKRAAEVLSVSRKTLYNKLAEYHLKI